MTAKLGSEAQRRRLAKKLFEKYTFYRDAFHFDPQTARVNAWASLSMMSGGRKNLFVSNRFHEYNKSQSRYSYLEKGY